MRCKRRAAKSGPSRLGHTLEEGGEDMITRMMGDLMRLDRRLRQNTQTVKRL
jgi:hypothetical protein